MPNPLIVLVGLYAIMGAQDYGRLPEPTRAEPTTIKKAAPAPVAVIASPPGRGLRDVPNIAIKYYDVTGKNLAQITRSIAAQRPTDPVTKRSIVGGAAWVLGVGVSKQTEGDKCTVTGVKANLAPTAELPRLLNEPALPPAELAAWRAYVAQLEVSAAAGLWFVKDRIPAFEQSLVGLDCAAATKLASDGIAKIRADHEQLQRQSAAAQAATVPPPPKN